MNEQERITKIYAFQYTDCIHESAMQTMSLHRTKKGAYKAMNKFLNNRFKEEREDVIMYGKSKLFDHVFRFEAWVVKPLKVEN